MNEAKAILSKQSGHWRTNVLRFSVPCSLDVCSVLGKPGPKLETGTEGSSQHLRTSLRDLQMGAGGAVPKASAGWAPQQPRESKASKIYDGASEEVLFFFLNVVLKYQLLRC